MCVCLFLSLYVVAECLWTVDAAVWATEFLLCCTGIGAVLLQGGAIIKVLHHYHQFTTQVGVKLGLRRVLMRVAGSCGGCRAGELVRKDVLRWSAGPLDWRNDFTLRG